MSEGIARFTPSRRGVAVIATEALTSLVFGPPEAAAHSNPLSSKPTAGQQVHTSPAELSPTFNENVEPTLVTVRIADSDEAEVAAATRIVSGSVVRVPTSATSQPDDYTLAYQVASADGHPVTGQLVYSVANSEGCQRVSKGPTPQSAQTVSPTATVGGARREPNTSTPILVIAGVIAVRLLALLLVKVYATRQ